MALDARAVYQLASFSETERKTLRLIALHVRDTGERCFDYLAMHRTYKRHLEVRIKWNTLERVLRKLAERGWLSREISGRRRKRATFCLTASLEYLLEQLGWLQ